MTKPRLTVGRSMLGIAAIAVEFGLLPTPLAIVAACLTLPLTLFATPVRSGVGWLAILALALLISPAWWRRPGHGRRYQCPSNLRQLSLALEHYRNANGCFPPAYVTDVAGKPLYSWRVLILPYLDQQDLYNAFNLSQPWDGPDNSRISSVSFRIFTCPDDDGLFNETSFLAITGPGTAFPPGGTTSTRDFLDGPATTILLAEVGSSKVRWAEPLDLDIRTMSFQVNDTTKPGVRSGHGTLPWVAFADSRVRAIPDSLPRATLKAMLTIRGGEKIDIRDR